MRKNFWETALLLVIIAAFLMGGTLEIQAETKRKAESQAYHEMEKDYLRHTREVLKEKGFADSGVNLTKIIDESGKRTYTVKIHNSKINALEEEEKDNLLKSLKNVKFADEESIICHEFLVVSNE